MLPIIETFSGKMLDYENPTEDMIDIVDIAHALSQICRFTGHCKQHYNVAQHSYHTSFLVEPEHALQALLHDATEAYIGDLNSPLKSLVAGYREIEERVWSVIARKFGVAKKLHSSVKRADLIMLKSEYLALMNPEYRNPIWNFPDDLPINIITPVSSKEAAVMFLERFNELQK